MNHWPRLGSIDGRVGPADLSIIAGQLGRPPRDLTGIAVRCPFGYPAVIETAPMLAGAPNPTLLYLTCPTMVNSVSKAEAAGAVKSLRAWVATDPEAASALEEVTRWYRQRQAFLAREQPAEVRLGAGIGGPSGPERATCLHAYAAALLAVMSGWLGAAANQASNVVPAEAAAEMVGLPTPVSEDGYAGVLWRIWTRFLPPVDRTWCLDGRCARFGASQSRPGRPGP